MLVTGFDLNAIPSLGSAIALVVFALVTAGHLRVRRETGANVWILGVALASTTVVLITFAFTTLVDEPPTAVTLVAILGISAALDFAWKKRRHDSETEGPSDVMPVAPQQTEDPS